jgi:hypothetical protein
MPASTRMPLSNLLDNADFFRMVHTLLYSHPFTKEYVTPCPNSS